MVKLILTWTGILIVAFVHAQNVQSPLKQFNRQGAKLKLFVFLSPECPLSINYTRTINELTDFYKKEVSVYGIFPGTAYSPQEIGNFKQKYKVNYSLVIDSSMSVTRFLHATVTPEAVLTDSNGNIVYSGAIDDWAQSLGKTRQKATRFYLKDAISQYLLSSVIIVSHTKAIGCKINDY